MASRRMGIRRSEHTRRRSLEELNKTAIGAVALAVLTALLASLVIVTKVGPGYRKYTAQFLQAAALQPKNPVTVAGVRVGTVTAMRLDGDRVLVDMRVDRKVALGKDTRADIMVTTILGSRYVALRPGSGGPLPGNVIDINHTTVPYDLQQALQDATATYGQVDTDKLASAAELLGQQIQSLPPLIPKALDNLHTLSSVMADRREQFGNMLRTMDLVTTTLHRQKTRIGGMVTEGQQLLSEFVTRRAAFHAMLQSLSTLVDALDSTVIGDRAELQDLLNDVNRLSGLLGEHDATLRAILQSAPVGLRGLVNATGTGNALDTSLSNGNAIDSWMCAISGRAKQFGMIEYFKDCK